MIKPTPILVTCKDCGYQKIFTPKSDAIMPSEYNLEFCTKCSSQHLKVESKIPFLHKLFLKLINN